jgi:hypothetical protein
LKSLAAKTTMLALFILLPSIGSGQTHSGSVRGKITDPNGALVPGAQVRLINEETNETRTMVSGKEGEFAFSPLAPSAYRLEVMATGFANNSNKLLLRVGQELRQDISLTVGSASETVQQYLKSDNSLKVDSESTAVRTVIDNPQVEGLPLDGRNFYELSLLVPGAVPPAPGSAGSVRGDFSFSVNGAREDSNNFLLDGVYNADPKLNTFAVRPPVDAIREFEIATSTYDAAFGRNPGAQVNVVLKSGGNNFHGSLFEFHRNAALDARNFFAPGDEPAPKYIRNQFGFSLGGPIRQDRIFFFTDYEGTRSREGLTRVANVPTLRERNGDFSQTRDADDNLISVRNPSTGQPFPGGVVPSFFIHPVGRAIAALYPLPNRAMRFANFVSSPTQRDDNDHFDARVDQVLSNLTTLVFRYSFGNRRFFEPFAGPTLAAVPGYGNEVPRRSQNALVGLTHVFSPILVNDTRFAFNRVASAVNQENLGTSVNRAVGLPELSGNSRDFGLSFITITGFSPLGHEGNNPQNTVTNTFQILNTATYVPGNHMFKFGADIHAVQQNGFRDVQSRGLLNFSPFAYTGVALADLLLGLPLVTGGARVDNAQHLRARSYHFFANDSFRVRRNVTISAGLRYEYNSAPVDVTDRATLYDPATRSLVPVGTSGMPRGGYNSDKNNFAPRVGLAWTFGNDEKTVIRAGYGIYYDTSPLAPGEALYFNKPYFDFSLFFPLPGLPLTLSDPFPAFFPFPLPDSAQAIQRDLRTPYMQHWNLNVQRQLGRDRVLEVGYVGSKGTKLLSARDLNQPQPSALPPGLPFVPRPVPQFDEINTIESRASSSYHSLQARLQQRLSAGLAMLASYTWSKSLDDASNFFPSAGDPNYPQNSYDLRAERGRSNFDVAHRLAVSYIYDLPLGKGRTYLANDGAWSKLVSGWQTSGIVTLQTGRPFTVALLREFDNSGTGISALGFGANDRPNVAGDPSPGQRSPERWFNTGAFVVPPAGTFGNAGRNTLDGPGYRSVNASLVKNTALSDTFNLQFRAEFFNLFNHPNFNLPDNFLGSSSFGQISSARDPRHVQFGVKLLF